MFAQFAPVLAAGFSVVLALSVPLEHGEAQTTWHATIAGGPADGRAGFVAHLGVRVARGVEDAWVQTRVDGTRGRLAGRTIGAGALGLELGVPEARTPGARLYGLLGASVVWTGGAGEAGLMAGAGVRVRLGRVWLLAEQRFQTGFSPFLVGLSF